MQVARTAAPDDATCRFLLSFKPVSLFCKTDIFSLEIQILHFAKPVNSAIIVKKRGMPCETLILFNIILKINAMP